MNLHEWKGSLLTSQMVMQTTLIAWECVTEDPFFLQSEGHPGLFAGFAPRAQSAMNARS